NPSILYSSNHQQERIQTESPTLLTSIHFQESAQTEASTTLSSTIPQENTQPSTLLSSTLSEEEIQTQPSPQTLSTLSQIVTSPQTITFSPPSSSNPPSEPVEENNINEAFTVEPRKATRPPPPPATRPTEVPQTSEEMVEPQPAPVFTPRPIFRPNPTSFTPPPSNTVEKVTIFGPPEKPEFDSEACVMPPDSGKCRNFVPRWFYNAEKGSCQEFSYGSCGGNANNFVDKITCESRCATPSVNAVLPQRCNWPKDEGFGIGYHPKWYFNGRNLRCEQMVFRGSGGNDNQFSSQSDCDLSCKPVQGSFVPQVPQPPPRKGHKETDKKQPLPTNLAHGTLTAVEGGYDGAGVPSPVQEIPDKAPAEVPYAPTANAPAGKQPTSPASGPAPATAPHAPSVDVNQYVPAPPPLRVDYNNVEENTAASAPAPAPTSHSTAPAQTPSPSSHSSSNSNVEENQGEGYNGQGSAPPSHVAPEELPSAPETHNHEAGINVGRGEYEEPTIPGINHEANINVHQNNGNNNVAHSNTVDMESVDETMSNTNQGHIEQSQSLNNVEQSHGSASSSNVEQSHGSATGAHVEQPHESQAGSNVQSHSSATSSNTQGEKYESNNENVE
uniref:BPTI/Kunitz inhibitor domain-containing protein n=1 Tax=Panagrolaimus sp. PS1159 TaxID=55785 RepID=A0AC35GSZ6_9BILA